MGKEYSVKNFGTVLLVATTALSLQACGRVTRLQGQLVLNTNEPVVLVDSNKVSTPLVAGPMSIKLGGVFGKTLKVENGTSTIEMDLPSDSIIGKDLRSLTVVGAKAGQSVNLVSKLVDIKHSPTSYTRDESCRLQRYEGVQFYYSCPGLADIYVCKWGTQTVTHDADTITEIYSLDFMDPTRSLSLATMNSQVLRSNSDAHYGPCWDNTPSPWQVCSVTCHYPPPHYEDHDGHEHGGDHDHPRH